MFNRHYGHHKDCKRFMPKNYTKTRQRANLEMLTFEIQVRIISHSK